MTREWTNFATAAVCLVEVLALVARCSTADMCGVDSTDPDSMSCNTGVDGRAGADVTAFESLTAQRVPLKPGLSYDFYDKSCPQYKSIVEDAIKQALKTNPLHAAGLTRIHFHDCFVRGCDASLLLNGTSGSEQTYVPNRTLKQASLQVVSDLKSKLEQACPNTVSCADTLALGTAEAIRLTKGPRIKVPLGRRDSLSIASNQTVTDSLPSPRQNVSQLMTIFSKLGLDYTDLVALSGAHTLGTAECVSFQNRLRPTVDPNLDADLASTLSQLCPNGSQNTEPLDSTPNKFDNKYFKQVLSGEGLLSSDAAMELDVNTVYLVKQFAKNKNEFHRQFVRSFLKMSQFSVLTGSAGELRRTCTAVNSPTT